MISKIYVLIKECTTTQMDCFLNASPHKLDIHNINFKNKFLINNSFLNSSLILNFIFQLFYALFDFISLFFVCIIFESGFKNELRLH
jgi:hypothetical protein